MDTLSTERAILTDFFKALNGENWRRHPNWLSKEPVGGWHGIRTDEKGRVTSIELGGNHLRGSIPGSLGGLSELRLLQLFDNEIMGPIPPELGDLSKLELLSLYRNRLSGPIPPELGNMTRLRELSAHDNALSGRIPDELCRADENGNAKALRWLNLANNCLHGPLPDVGALRKLRAFFVSGNAGLYGDLPPGLTDLPLKYIAFDGTQLRAPDSQGFRQWLDRNRITNYTGLEWNATTDREALVELFHATRGPEWRNRTGWLSDQPLGEWAGVDTNAAGRVVRLLLGGNGLVGAIPCRLGTLTALKDLRLDHNRLEGVPAALGSLVNLEMLNLSYSAMKGEIPPQLGRLRKLKTLDLRDNRLVGSIPAELGDMAALKALWLYSNEVEGPIPGTLGNLRHLVRMVLSLNRLTGGIPDEFRQLRNLQVMALNNNALSGQIPASLGLMSSLVRLNLSENDFSGRVPAEIGNLGELKVLAVSGNEKLAGALPKSYKGLKNLELFYFDETGLCQPEGLEAWLAGVPKLRGTNPCTDREALVELFHATGGPEWRRKTGWLSERPLGEWAGVDTNAAGRVVRLRLGGNRLVGALPRRLGTLTALKDLRLDNNSLEGGVPAALGSLVNLETLDLYSNRLTGPIPGTLGNLRHLVQMVLSLNRLTGGIPQEFRQLKNLQVMAINNNQLSGEIPASLGLMSSLVRLNLSNNGFSGRVPPEIGNLDQLKVLAVSGNSGLAGALRKSYKGLKNLELFYFDDTGLCEPEDLKGWLARVPKLRGTRDCEFYEETRD